jgi:hypothetical protein
LALIARDEYIRSWRRFGRMPYGLLSGCSTQGATSQPHGDAPDQVVVRQTRVLSWIAIVPQRGSGLPDNDDAGMGHRPVGTGGPCEGLEQRSACVSSLQQRCEDRYRRNCLKQGLALCHRNRRQRNRSNKKNGHQNQKPEANSKNQSNQRTANGQCGHTTYSIQTTVFSNVGLPKIGLI